MQFNATFMQFPIICCSVLWLVLVYLQGRIVAAILSFQNPDPVWSQYTLTLTGWIHHTNDQMQKKGAMNPWPCQHSWSDHCLIKGLYRPNAPIEPDIFGSLANSLEDYTSTLTNKTQSNFQGLWIYMQIRWYVNVLFSNHSALSPRQYPHTLHTPAYSAGTIKRLLVWTGDGTPVEGKVGTVKRLVTNFNESKYDLILTIRWQWLRSIIMCNQIVSHDKSVTQQHTSCPHEKYSMISWLMT